MVTIFKFFSICISISVLNFLWLYFGQHFSGTYWTLCSQSLRITVKDHDFEYEINNEPELTQGTYVILNHNV